MNVFFGFCSYLWFFGIIHCALNDSGWQLAWWTIFVILFSYVGRGIIYMVSFVYKMRHNPAFFHDIMDSYLAYIIQQQDIRSFLKYDR